MGVFSHQSEQSEKNMHWQQSKHRGWKTSQKTLILTCFWRKQQKQNRNGSDHGNDSLKPIYPAICTWKQSKQHGRWRATSQLCNPCPKRVNFVKGRFKQTKVTWLNGADASPRFAVCVQKSEHLVWLSEVQPPRLAYQSQQQGGSVLFTRRRLCSVKIVCE